MKIKQAEIKLVKKIYENSFKIYGYKKCSKVASLSEWKVYPIYKILTQLDKPNKENLKRLKLLMKSFPILLVEILNH